MSKPELLFNQIPVSRDRFVAALRVYLGLPYFARQTFIYRDEDGRPRGHANCFGVILQACIDCELLPADFDKNLEPRIFGQSKARTLREIISLNGIYLPAKELMQPGDILLLQY
jgi:hypothetical protein